MISYFIPRNTNMTWDPAKDQVQIVGMNKILYILDNMIFSKSFVIAWIELLESMFQFVLGRISDIANILFYLN